ncbi:L-threonylcarbamoyladenylate synthase [Sphingomonas naphthae]|uniref:Threonylcarbamoyl-AMP synthase n=1 Tax=Sphingomonas naphthae TaxID=1813468 RepID=A0ABY7TI38_9SPHN|nr:L-threonylcarbamoyladenylate synthase [Sphingomonas naphthae]WCT72100.1 L-threonylcarbamoyladenylate synthase [Sphingomonas naphthae]
MQTRIIPADPAGIAEAAALIRARQPVAVPSETVYGLAADATDSEAVARIYAAKGRPAFNPLIVHVADLAAARAIASLDTAAEALAARFWPGPLTLVLPLRPDAGIASLVTAGLDTIAIRVPAHPAMQALIAASGRPLAAPSANASGTISPTRGAHVARSLDGKVALILDGGATGHGLESTIAAPGPGTLRLLRPGPITAAMLSEATGLPVTSPTGGAIEAPGQLAAHYAPSKPLRLDATDARDGEWLIGFGSVAGHVSLSPTGDPVEAAARLFDLLHEADAGPAPSIAIAPIPHDGLGAAITDRLARAAMGAAR